MLIYGVLLLIVILSFPGGLFGIFKEFTNRKHKGMKSNAEG
jgi:hypothetical protein